MRQQHSISLIDLLHFLTLLCAALLAGLGGFVLIGWIFELPYIVNPSAQYVPMTAGTAMLLLLSAGMIFLRAKDSPSRADRIFGLALNLTVGISAAVLLILSYQGIHLGIEYPGLAPYVHAGKISVSHISPLTAICFLLAFLSYHLLLVSPPTSWRVNLAWGLAVLLTVTGGFLLLMYSFGVPVLYDTSFIPPSALIGAAIVLLGIALFGLCTPSSWLIRYRYDESVRAGRIYVLIFIVMAAGILAVGYASYRNFEKQFRIQAEYQLTAVADLKTRELTSWRKERRADAELLYGNPIFSALVSTYLKNPQDISARIDLYHWLNEFASFDQYDRVRLLDRQGTTLISIPDNLLPPSPWVTSEIPLALRTRQITFVDFYRSEGTYITMLIPILDEKDPARVLAFVTLRIDPTVDLYPYIEAWPSASKTAETLLVRRDGGDILVLNELRFQKDTALNLHIPLTQVDMIAVKAVLGESGVVQGVDYRGVPVIGDVRRIPESPWFLVALMDTAEVDASLRARLIQTVGIISMLVCVSGAFLLLIWRQQRIRFYREQVEAASALLESKEELQHHLSELKVLYDNGLAIGILREPREIARKIVATLSENLSWHHIAIRLRRGETDELELIAVSQPNLTDEDVAKVEERLNAMISWVGQGLSGWSVQTRKPLRASDVRQHPQYVDTYPGILSGLYVPMMIGERAIGCIAVENTVLDAFTEEDERLLVTLAAQTAIAFENARLYQSLQQELDERLRAEAEILQLNASLEQRVDERTQELRDAQEKLVRQERLATLGQLAGSVGHELRNPLAVISNAVYFLKLAQPEANEKIKEYLNIIENETRVSDKIVTDLLDFTRIKSIDRKAVSISELIRQIMLRYPAPAYVNVTLDLPADLPPIYVDPQHMTQILGNLTLNAYQAMKDQDAAELGQLAISTTVEGKMICIVVKDSGTGISPDNMKKLFEPLFTTKSQGIGLGLAVSRKLVEANGGRIEVQSVLGAGSVFKVYFPVYEEVI